MQPFFSSWESFAADVRAAAHLLLLADYDGTLTPIVSRPEEAVLSPAVREKLAALVVSPFFSVGIISGRALAEVRSLVGIEGIYYAGNHGLEMAGPGIHFVSPEARAAQVIIKDLAGQLSARLSSITGVIVEDKGLTLSLHYRLVREGEVDRVADIFRQVTAPWLSEGSIRITSGKKVWEVRPPVDWHKGKAVRVIMEQVKARLSIEPLLTVYLGDDVTDEDAFRVVRRPRGWGIRVGGDNPASAAEYFLGSTAEVAGFLSRLLELAGERQ